LGDTVKYFKLFVFFLVSSQVIMAFLWLGLFLTPDFPIREFVFMYLKIGLPIITLFVIYMTVLYSTYRSVV